MPAPKTPSQPSEFVAPTDPENLCSWLEQKRELGRRTMPELQMKLNLAFMLGHQWVV